MNKSLMRRYGVGKCLVLAGVIGFTAGLGATDLKWTSTTGGAFGTASNWTPQRVPGNGDVLTIPIASGQSLALTNNIEGLTVDRLIFADGGLSNEGTITLSGSPVTISATGASTSAALFVYYPRTHIQVPVTFTADNPYLTVWSRGQLYFEDTVTCSGRLIGTATPYTESLTSAGAPVRFMKAFSAAEGFEIRTGHYICGAAGVLDKGLVITFACTDATKNASSLNLEGYDQTIDRFTLTSTDKVSNIHALVRNTTSTACTLTMNATADGGTDALFSGPLSLVWNPAADYAFTVTGGRASTMTGSIAVRKGTFAVTDGTTFGNVHAVTLDSGTRCVWTNWPFATDTFALTAAEGVSFWSDPSAIRFPAATFTVTGTLTFPDNAKVAMASTTKVAVSDNFVFNGVTLAPTDAGVSRCGNARAL